MSTKWDIRFLRRAREVSTWSKDPTTQVGAVLALNKRAISDGYNGFPDSLNDETELLENREEKLKRTIHAEVNAILHAQGRYANSLYLYPVYPCSHCAAIICQSRISRIVAVNTEKLQHWMKNKRFDVHTSMAMFAEAGIETMLYDEQELG